MRASETLPSYSAPSLTPHEADLARIFARRRQSLAAGPWRIDFVAPPETISGGLIRSVWFGGHAAIATMDPTVHDALLRGLDPAAPQAPEDLACLLLEAALAGLLRDLPELALTIALAAGPLHPAISLGLACRSAEAAGLVRLDLDAGAACVLAPFWDRLAVRREIVPGLTVKLSVRALATDLPVAALRALQAGDVILADRLDGGDVLLVAGERLAWRASRQGESLQVATPRLSPGRAGLGGWMVELPVGDASGEDSPIGELPIRLTFEFGRIDVPLDELEAIGPGHVFQFARPAGEPVDIMANGRRIGRGRVVEINGEVGVQVVWIGRHE